jgi:hypothetical protein
MIYEKAFTMLFQNLFKVTGQLIQFHHIHHTGFQGILADMCGKQAHGKLPRQNQSLASW